MAFMTTSNQYPVPFSGLSSTDLAKRYPYALPFSGSSSTSLSCKGIGSPSTSTNFDPGSMEESLAPRVPPILVPIDLPILVPMVFPIASPMLVPAVVIDCSKTPPDPAGAAAALAGGGGAAELFAEAAGRAGETGALLVEVEGVMSTAPSAAEPALAEPKEGNDGREPMRLEKEFNELPVPAPDPPVKLLREGKVGKVGNTLAEDFPLELPELPLLPQPGRVLMAGSSSWLRAT
jgi:hypothetical protein